MAGIQLGGLATGMDTTSIITQLMSIERIPQDKLRLQQRQVQARETALKDVATRLRNLKDAATALRSSSTWANVQSLDSSDPTRVSARLVGGAGPGGYSLSVNQLAGAEQRTFNYTSQGSDSTITIGGTPVTITGGSDIQSAADQINASGNVYANVINGQLVLSANTTGAASAFTAVGAAVSEDTAKARAGQDALYQVDSGPVQSSSTNIVTSAIPGVELTFKAVTTGPVTVNVGVPTLDSKAASDKVKAFVDQYNSTVDFIRGKLDEKPVKGASSDADLAKGVLRGDSMLNGLLSQLRNAIADAVPGNPATLDQLAEIGVSTGATTGDGSLNADSVAGKLTLDATKLTDQLAADPTGVRQLLGGVTGISGFAQRIEALIDPITQTQGLLDTRVASAESEISRLTASIAGWDTRLTQRQSYLQAQFTAMEQAVSANQQQQSWLSSQLAQLG
jgi:flagellar hook-associated protein 2